MTQLKRVFTLRHLVLFGLAYLAPTVVFNIFGIITTLTDGMMALAYLLTTAVMCFTAYSYASMVKAFPVAGSAYTYVRRSVHPHLGFLTGWVMLLDYILLPMICYLLVAIYMNEFIPSVPIWVWVVSTAAIGFVTNVVGLKVSGLVNSVVVGAQLLFCLGFVIIVAMYVTGGEGAGTLFDPVALYNPETFDAPNLFWAASILAASFLGFDAVSTLAEDTVDPAKNISKAVLIVPIVAGFGFSLVSYAMQIAWPLARVELEDPDAGVFELLARLGGNALSTTFLITDNLASMVCALAGLAAASRILYGMGRDGAIPKFFGVINGRFRTPVNNIAVITVVALSAIFYSDNLMGAASLISFGALSGFIMVNYSVISHYFIRGRRRSGADVIRYLALPAIGALVCAVLVFYMDTHAQILGGLWLLMGAVYLGVSTRGFQVPPVEISMSVDDNARDKNPVS